MIRAALLALALSAPAFADAVRVEPRALVKERHFFLTGGLSWLERGDLYVSPGVALNAAWYATERDGFEVRTLFFLSRLNAAAQEVRDSTGLVPDSQRPRALLQLGWRHALTYGKLALGSSAVHFDVQVGAHGGVLATDRAATPALTGFAGIVARGNDRLFFQLDLNGIASIEQRTGRTVVLGFMPLLSAGVRL